MIITFFILITIIAGICGIINSSYIECILEVNSFSSPYYKLGISFLKYEEENMEELTIGVFFINISLRFYKEEQ